MRCQAELYKPPINQSRMPQTGESSSSVQGSFKERKVNSLKDVILVFDTIIKNVIQEYP